MFKQSSKFLECVGNNIFDTEKPNKEEALLDLLFTNRGTGWECAGGSWLGWQWPWNYRVRDLKRGRKENSKIKTLDFRKTDFSKHSKLLACPPRRQVRGEKEPRITDYFKEIILRMQKQVFLMQWKNGNCNRRPAWVASNLLKELNLEKESYKKWKVGYITREEYKGIAWVSREKVRKTKAQLEIQLAKGHKRQ